MAEVAKFAEAGGFHRKRKSSHNKGRKGNKKGRVFQGSGEKVKKIDSQKRKLYQKRAREYTSDGDDDDDVHDKKPSVICRQHKPKVVRFEKKTLGPDKNKGKFGRDDRKTLGPDNLTEEPLSEDEEEDADADDDTDALPGITKFSEGVRAFKAAFKSIIKKSVSDDTLGPILSGQQKLVAEKLAEEEAEKKQKGDSKKEKHKIAERGHVKPTNYLDAHDKFLVGVATKGVVKLFNAVNKAQHAQKGLNPSSFKDEKAIKKKRKEAFFGELGKRSRNLSKGSASSDGAANEGPSWAPLRDNFMLTNSKLKNWDKMQEKAVDDDDMGNMSEDSSSDED